MTLYFDYRVNIGPVGANTSFTTIDWHQQHALLAVALYNTEKGGSVYICDDLGEKLKDIEPAYHPTSEVVLLSWHPNRRTLVIAWQNGELRVWNGDSEYILVQLTKPSVIKMGKWSQQGSKFVTIDNFGEIGGWRLDARGQLISLFFVKPDSGNPICLEMRVAKSSLDIAGLAKKAVAGDEQALDMFSAWRPKTAGRRTAVQMDATAFYVGTDNGYIYHINESGFMREVASNLGLIQKLLHYEKEDCLLVIVEGLNMNYYSIDPNGNLQEVTKVKLSTSAAMTGCSVVWAGSGVLACAVGDMTVRIWEPSTGDSYSLIFSRSDAPQSSLREMITTLAFSKNKGLLCGCTNAGTVIIWKVNGKGYDAWTQVASTKLKQSIKHAMWGANQLAINSIGTVYVLKEHTLSAIYQKKILVIQTSATQMIVSTGDKNVELNTDLQVSGIALNDEIVAVWSGKMMAVYHHLASSISVMGSFSCECVAAGVWNNNLIVLTMTGKIEVLTLQGTVKQYVDTDGQPITLSLTSNFMTISTMTGTLQVWDLSRREAKPHSKVKDLIEAISDFGEVISAVCNSNGTKVALTIASSNLTPIPGIYVWCIEEDVISSHHFHPQNEPMRFVISMHWDSDEPRLLVCEAKRPVIPPSNRRITASTLSRQETMSPTTVLVSFLVTPEHGMLLKDVKPVDDEFVSLLGVDIPYFIVIKKSSQQKIVGSKILMKDFEGLEEADSQTKNAVINFSFSLSVGDVDQAFKSIRNIKSPAVWTSLAKMCVKGKRLDVAKVCLGRMGHTRGVTALKEAENEPEEEARVAALALQLGMVTEAEELYESCGRYDLLNKLYQRSDQWDKAVEIAQKYDRIHLRNTYHHYGKFLELSGDTPGAAHMYQKAETHRHEVPRMLLGDILALEKYIVDSKDPVLLKWWAQFKEMKGDKKTATKFYEDARDYTSLVRMMCHAGEMEKATQIAETTGDKAACYYLAGRYEEMGILPTAVHFYTRATAYTNAMRLCKEQGLEDQLWALSLSAGPREQAEAAKFLEAITPERAVLLYHKAGMFHKALDLAFRNNQFDAVELIATELTSDDDKELLVKCADYFIEQEHFEKAVHLLAIAKQYESAIKLSWDHNVLLNEELAEKLSPEEGHENRVILLETLADCALAQANYHLATKKYTQAGNKMKAMKALLKSGDTDKIIFFANITRQKEMYVMAANYLQSLDWRVKPELLKTIISFYTKGKAPHLLANFYVACAQVEVDDFRNYNKALGALNEASKSLSGPNADQYSNLKEMISRKTALVNKFLDATRQFERGENEAGMQTCRILLSSGESELVRKGDVYALMIENTVRNNDLVAAKTLVHELKLAQPNDTIDFYLTKDILARLGIEVEQTTNDEGQSDGDDNVIDETV
ncbi:intraflagellar transport protein 140 homolog [Cimex lectularius]|uniref:Intraflagellar transport protein 140 homolog n=1 Tax=Cimex lectularius TaxID=79782 RepID=A0A8I6RKW8_CIMLE|nr:intraflagellar transport protein 140 homolog [Cimex lectularius]